MGQYLPSWALVRIKGTVKQLSALLVSPSGSPWPRLLGRTSALEEPETPPGEHRLSHVLRWFGHSRTRGSSSAFKVSSKQTWQYQPQVHKHQPGPPQRPLTWVLHGQLCQRPGGENCGGGGLFFSVPQITPQPLQLA